MNLLLISKKITLIKKVLREDRDFSTRLVYANEKIRETWMNVVNTTYNSKGDMIDKLQQSEGETIIKCYTNMSNFMII